MMFELISKSFELFCCICEPRFQPFSLFSLVSGMWVWRRPAIPSVGVSLLWCPLHRGPSNQHGEESSSPVKQTNHVDSSQPRPSNLCFLEAIS